jgi:hypothetical protein
MLLASAPAQLVLPWGNGDSSKTNPIPVPSQIGVLPGAASWTDGFPPLCAMPVTSGGVPPAKADMNGGLFQMSAVDVWMCAGGGFPYSATFSAAIGGYPLGARVLMASGLGYWRSVVDGNTTNPDTGGAGWVQDSGFRLQTVAYSATPAFNLNAGNIIDFTLTGNAAPVLSGIAPAMACIIHQDSVGGHTFTWPATVSAPPIGSAASQTSTISFLIDGGGIWRPWTAMTLS